MVFELSWRAPAAAAQQQQPPAAGGALRRRKVQRAARLLLETSKELLAELRKREATRHVDEMMR